jgi:hypothetical protein
MYSNIALAGSAFSLRSRASSSRSLSGGQPGWRGAYLASDTQQPSVMSLIPSSRDLRDRIAGLLAQPDRAGLEVRVVVTSCLRHLTHPFM